MADRTAAGIFGDVFCILAKRKNQEEASAIAAEVFALVSGYDFCEEQMEADKALKKLGLAREVPDPEYPGEMMVQYGPEGKKRRKK